MEPNSSEWPCVIWRHCKKWPLVHTPAGALQKYNSRLNKVGPQYLHFSIHLLSTGVWLWSMNPPHWMYILHCTTISETTGHQTANYYVHLNQPSPQDLSSTGAPPPYMNLKSLVHLCFIDQVCAKLALPTKGGFKNLFTESVCKVFPQTFFWQSGGMGLGYPPKRSIKCMYP